MKPLAVCQRLDLHKNCQKYESVPCISFSSNSKLNRGRNSLENELLHSIIPVRHLFSLLTSERLSFSKVPLAGALGDFFFAQVNNCQGGQFVHFCTTCVFLSKSMAARRYSLDFGKIFLLKIYYTAKNLTINLNPR